MSVWHVLICLCLCSFCENLIPHISQANGLSPVCVLMCRLSKAGTAKLFPHTWHGWRLLLSENACGALTGEKPEKDLSGWKLPVLSWNGVKTTNQILWLRLSWQLKESWSHHSLVFGSIHVYDRFTGHRTINKHPSPRHCTDVHWGATLSHRVTLWLNRKSWTSIKDVTHSFFFFAHQTILMGFHFIKKQNKWKGLILAEYGFNRIKRAASFDMLLLFFWKNV